MRLKVETSVTLHLKNDNWVKQTQEVEISEDDIVTVLKLDQGITDLDELHDVFMDMSVVLSESVFQALKDNIEMIE